MTPEEHLAAERKRWRAEIREQVQRALKLEQRAAELLPIPFRIRPDYPARLDWWANSESLGEFRARVQHVTNVLGRPPDETWYPDSSLDKRPSVLWATWNYGGYHIDVTSSAPPACRYHPHDPISKMSEPPTRRLHPECEAALRELTDLPVEAPA